MSKTKRGRPGTGHLYKREGSRVWWAQYRVRRKRYRRSTGETNRKAAESVLREWLVDAGRGGWVSARADNLTLSVLLDEVETDYRMRRLRSLDRVQMARPHLEEFLAESYALDVDESLLKKYVLYRQKEGAADATIDYELAILRRGFRLMRKVLRYQPDFPMLNASKRNARRGFVEPNDLPALLAQLPADVAALVEFMFYTGWRISEALGLIWDRLDFHHGTVRLDESKTGTGRTFVFDHVPGLRSLLERQAAKRKMLGGRPRRVFFRDWREDVPMRRSTVGRPLAYRDYVLPEWRRACVRVGFGNFEDRKNEKGYSGLILHDLRRSAVRNLVRAGVPRSTAMRITGHRTENIFERYNIEDETDLRRGAARLGEYLAGFGPQFSPQVEESET